MSATPPADPPLDIIALLKARRSVRAFTAEPLPVPTLRALLEAAMAAPSACASDPWEFVVVTAPETLAQLRDKLLFARYVAPAAIVVCGNVAVANNSVARHYWVQDCAAALENLLIAATGLGLGAVWIGLYPMEAPQAAVRAILGIPEGVTPLGRFMRATRRRRPRRARAMTPIASIGSNTSRASAAPAKRMPNIRRARRRPRPSNRCNRHPCCAADGARSLLAHTP